MPASAWMMIEIEMAARLLALINISPLSLLHLFHHCLRIFLGAAGK
jgi:hypothetical protein